jgi:hypothetical protein
MYYLRFETQAMGNSSNIAQTFTLRRGIGSRDVIDL